MKYFWNVCGFLVIFLLSFAPGKARADTQWCYVKRGIEDGSLSVRTAPRLPNLSKEEDNEVALLFELTPVKCERKGGWLIIQGTDNSAADDDGNTIKPKPMSFYFRDGVKYFEPSGFKPQVKINPDKNARVVVYNLPGYDYKTCKKNEFDPVKNKDGCKVVSWPGRDAKIDILDVTIAWENLSNRYLVYYKVYVQYNYFDPVKKKLFNSQHPGWIRAPDLEFSVPGKSSLVPTGSQSPVTVPPSVKEQPSPVVKSPTPPLLPSSPGPMIKTPLPFVRPSPPPEVTLEPPLNPVVTELPTENKLPMGDIALDEDMSLPQAQTSPVNVYPPLKLNPPTESTPQTPELRGREVEELSYILEGEIQFAVNTLKLKLGECLLSETVSTVGKTKKIKMSMPPSNGYRLPFDDYLMAGYWNKIKNKIRPFQIPNRIHSQDVGIKEIIAIDTLARTIYGEMAICSNKPNWQKYLQAVARISLNRMKAINSEDPQIRTEAEGRFVNKASDKYFSDLKHDMTRVLIEPAAYSVWNRPTKAYPSTSHLKQLLCPPAPRNIYMYNGSSVKNNAEERSIWEHAFRYAVEAVLFPAGLEIRTSGLNAHFYTSNMKMRGGAVITPGMNGFTRFDKYCIQMWREKNTKL